MASIVWLREVVVDSGELLLRVLRLDDGGVRLELLVRVRIVMHAPRKILGAKVARVELLIVFFFVKG